MDKDEFANLVGGLTQNLLALEFFLRAFLYSIAYPPHTPLPEGTSLESLQVGDQLPENAFTDYSTLGELIDRYNNHIQNVDSKFSVSRSIVALRDRLAHGRVSSTTLGGIPTLLKFSKPEENSTKVTDSIAMTSDWFNHESALVLEAIRTIENAPGSPVPSSE